MRAPHVFLAALLVMSAMNGASASVDAVRGAVYAFLDAFENGDIDAMEASFADGASTFPRAIMAADLDDPIDADDYRRVNGIDPQMRALIESLRAEGRTPPYLTLAPEDMKIQMYGRAAVVTFHLGGARLGRRTFVLAEIDAEWKIVHLHASNVIASE